MRFSLGGILAALALGGAACDSTTPAGGDADAGDVPDVEDRTDVEETTPDDAGEATDVEDALDEGTPDVADGEDGDDGETTHEELLGGLGGDTTPDEPLDPEGRPLREGYRPLGRAHATLLPKMETYLLRHNHAGRHQYLLDDARADWADL